MPPALSVVRRVRRGCFVTWDARCEASLHVFAAIAVRRADQEAREMAQTAPPRESTQR